MGKVFLSYRQADAAGYAGRIRERLTRWPCRVDVFQDVDGIAPGRDFEEAIAEAMAECDVLLLVIGPRFLDDVNKARLHDPNDHLRQEVAAGLASARTRVVPVLVNGASLPGTADLPDDLHRLALRQGFELHNDRFARDVDDLVRRLGIRRCRPVLLVAAAVVALIAVASGAALALSGGGDPPPATTTPLDAQGTVTTEPPAATTTTTTAPTTTVPPTTTSGPTTTTPPTTTTATATSTTTTTTTTPTTTTSSTTTTSATTTTVDRLAALRRQAACSALFPDNRAHHTLSQEEPQRSHLEEVVDGMCGGSVVLQFSLQQPSDVLALGPGDEPARVTPSRPYLGLMRFGFPGASQEDVDEFDAVLCELFSCLEG